MGIVFCFCNEKNHLFVFCGCDDRSTFLGHALYNVCIYQKKSLLQRHFEIINDLQNIRVLFVFLSPSVGCGCSLLVLCTYREISWAFLFCFLVYVVVNNGSFNETQWSLNAPFPHERWKIRQLSAQVWWVFQTQTGAVDTPTVFFQERTQPWWKSVCSLSFIFKFA